MTAAIVQFGKMPTAMARAGAYAGLAPSELAALVVISANLNGSDWSAELTLQAIAEMAGMARRSIMRGIRGLETKGLLITRQSRGRHASRYTLVTNRDSGVRVERPQPGQLCPGCDDSTGTVVSGLPCVNPDTTGRQPGHIASPTRTDVSPSSDIQIFQQGPAAGKDCEEPVNAIKVALGVSGVEEPTRSQLAKALEGISGAPGLIADTAERLQRTGKGTGMLVNEIRGSIVRWRLQQRQRAEHQKFLARERDSERAYDERIEAERAERDRLLAVIPADKLRALVKQARADAAPNVRERWSGATIDTNAGLRYAVACLARVSQKRPTIDLGKACDLRDDR